VSECTLFQRISLVCAVEGGLELTECRVTKDRARESNRVTKGKERENCRVTRERARESKGEQYYDCHLMLWS
jgi:hypothetical protein